MKKEWQSLMRSPKSVLIHVVMFSLALFWLYPYLWMFLSSFKTNESIFQSGLFGGTYTLENYRFLLVGSQQVQKPFLRALMNSAMVAVTVTASVIITSIIVSYALAKIPFRGRKSLHNFLIFQMVFPGFMFIIPQFILMRKFQLIDSYGALIIPFLMSGWAIFMLAQSFKSTPDDYIEAARIDGASELWLAFKIVTPLNRNMLAIVGIFTFTGVWDNFLWPLIVIKGDELKMPLSVLLASFNRAYGVYVGSVLAGSVLQTLPLLILFIIFRRYFLEGMNLSLK